MKFQSTKCLVATGLLAMAGMAQAATITFDSLTNPGIWQYTSDTYTEQGYSFAATLRTNGYSLYSYGTSNPLNADSTGATLGENYDGEGLVVSLTGGGTFTLTSFDLANGFNDGTGGAVRFSYTDGLGTHDGALALAQTPGLQNFSFNYAGVTSFTLWDDDFQVDNVVLSDAAIAVPEPATYALFLAGLALLARRRKV